MNLEILCNKLDQYRIRAVVLMWVSYLSGRQQFIKLEEFSSKCLDIPCGIPEGSVSGPKLFILCINESM